MNAHSLGALRAGEGHQQTQETHLAWTVHPPSSRNHVTDQEREACSQDHFQAWLSHPVLHIYWSHPLAMKVWSLRDQLHWDSCPFTTNIPPVTGHGSLTRQNRPPLLEASLDVHECFVSQCFA